MTAANGAGTINGIGRAAVEDTDGNCVTFTWSSALREDGPCVWAWIDAPNEPGVPVALHLNQQGLRELRDVITDVLRAIRTVRAEEDTK